MRWHAVCRIGGYETLMWLAAHHLAFDFRARPPSSPLACSAAKLRAYGEALGFVLPLVEGSDALGGLIGLRHDLWNRCDLPQRALAEWAYSKEAINNPAPLAYHLPVALDGQTQTMLICTRKPPRKQAPDQRLVEVGLETRAVIGEIGLDHLKTPRPALA